MNRRNTTAMTSALALLLAAGGCDSTSEGDASEARSTAHAAAESALRVDASAAPTKLEELVPWTESTLGTFPGPQPLPAAKLPAPKWGVDRLIDELDNASVTTAWESTARDTQPLARVGPFRSDQPTPLFSADKKFNRKTGHMLELGVRGFQVQREDVGAILLDIEAPWGDYIDLVWNVVGLIRLPLPGDHARCQIRVETEGLERWEGMLGKLFIRTDGVQEGVIKIHAIEFLPQSQAFPEAVGVRAVRPARDRRPAVYMHTPSSVVFSDIELPPNAKFQSGLAVLANDATPNGAEVQMSLIVRRNGDEQTVLDETVRSGADWIDYSTSLAEWAGQNVDIEIRVKSPDPDAVALWGSPTIYEPVEDPPIFIVYLIDTLGALHMDLYGYPRPTMPFLRRTAQQRGAWFVNAYCNSPVTVSSIPDLMLSVPAERHQTYAESMHPPLELVTFAETLQAAGFATWSFVTNVNAGPRQCMDQGFDVLIDHISFANDEGALRTVELSAVDRWLNYAADRPILMYVHTAEPHYPYEAPEQFTRLFATGYSGRCNGKSCMSLAKKGVMTLDEIKHVHSLYDAECLFADSQLARFHELLEQRGVADRATTIVIADHGEEIMEKGHLGHGKGLAQPVLRIPMVAWGPLIKRRGPVDELAQLLDVMPTVLDLLDVSPPYDLVGDSLADVLRVDSAAAPAAPERVIVVSHHRYRGQGKIEYAVIENAKWKLTRDVYNIAGETTAFTPSEGPRGELASRFLLYDLENDPQEQTDLLAERPEVARRLLLELVRYAQAQRPYEGHGAEDARSFSAAQIKELQTLGYVGDSDEEDPNEPNDEDQPRP